MRCICIFKDLYPLSPPLLELGNIHEQKKHRERYRLAGKPGNPGQAVSVVPESPVFASSGSFSASSGEISVATGPGVLSP